MRPRVGHIQFLNCLPLYYGLVKTGSALDVELVKGTPTELNRMLVEGKLDVSAISSIEYARHRDQLVLLPDFTVSADGEVKSILLLTKGPVEELDGRTVALTTTSATSRVLARFLLERHYQVRPRYVDSPPDLAMMMMEADGALLIGDDALRALFAPLGLRLLDLGKVWKEVTGLPFVFAVWAARREYAEKHPRLVSHVHRLFTESLRYSQEHLAAVATDISRWEPFSANFLEDYFRTLRFTFAPPYQEGLLRFYREALELGELGERVAALEFAGV